MTTPQRGNLYYLAGPMSGRPDWNFPAFHEVAASLREQGLRILNPAETAGGDPSMEKPRHMRIDFGCLLAADGILLLDGWERSDDAKRELLVADALGLPAWEIRPGERAAAVFFNPISVRRFEIMYDHTAVSPPAWDLTARLVAPGS